MLGDATISGPDVPAILVYVKGQCRWQMYQRLKLRNVHIFAGRNVPLTVTLQICNLHEVRLLDCVPTYDW